LKLPSVRPILDSQWPVLVAVFIAAGSTFPVAAQPQLVDKVVAVVGDKVILMSDVESLFMRYEQEGPIPDSMRCALLDQLMGQKMLLAQAELDSVTVGEEQVEYELGRRLDYFVQLLGGQEQLEEYYGMSYEEMKEQFRNDIREQLLAQKMQADITDGIAVTPKEVRDYFNSIPVDSLPVIPVRVQVGQIVMHPKITEVQEQLARDLAVEVRDKIKSGRNFCSMAALYSCDDATKQDCGELPEFGRNDGYAKEFVAAAFKLQEGEMSDIVETEFGYHLIEMMKRSGERVLVRHILICPKVTSYDLERVAQVLDSVRTLIVSGDPNGKRLTFLQAAARFSDDDITKNSNGMLTNAASGDQWFSMLALHDYDAAPQLPSAELQALVTDMKVGDISRPVQFKDARGEDAMRIIWLKAEVTAHVADLKVDYALIEAEALEVKKSNATEDWLNERISKTYVKIDESYGDCSVLRPWIR
jgi:peptidyl-prolyl cis-trans isomerase SurA